MASVLVLFFMVAYPFPRLQPRRWLIAQPKGYAAFILFPHLKTVPPAQTTKQMPVSFISFCLILRLAKDGSERLSEGCGIPLDHDRSVTNPTGSMIGILLTGPEGRAFRRKVELSMPLLRVMATISFSLSSAAPRLHARIPESPWLPCLLIGLVLWLLPFDAWAVRPFVTDDARIVYQGQLETESWAEIRLRQGLSPGYHFASLQGYSPTDRLEIIAGGIGLDYDERRLTLDDLILQPKYVILRSLDSYIPSISAAAAILGPVSGNRQQWNNYAMFHASWFLFTPPGSTDPYDNGLAIHANLGTKGQYDAGLGGG
jgi:hypothetical protein